MKKLLSTCLLFFVLFTLSAQQTPLINSGELITQAVELTDSKEYEQALALYLSIPQSDTNYVKAIYEIGYLYDAAEKYDSAIYYASKGIKLKSRYKSQFYNALANLYDKTGESEKALSLYNEGLQLYPYDHMLHYNHGVALSKTNNYSGAMESFINALRVKPFHANSHYALGQLMILQGSRTKAMMSLLTHLMIAPKNNSALVRLENLLNDGIREEGSVALFASNDEFHQMDLLLKSRAAKDERFKTKVDFNASVVSQSELLIEMIEYKESEDLWMKFYVPFFQRIYKDKLSEAFLYYLLTSTNNEMVNKWIEKNTDKLKQFVIVANEELSQFRTRHETSVAGEKGLYNYWYTDKSDLVSIGNTDDNDERHGPWIFFHANNEVQATGRYKNGKLTGNWFYYYEDGTLQKSEVYDDQGSLIEEIRNYYPTGQLKNVLPVVNNEVNGNVQLYYECGQPQEIYPYKDGKPQGDGIIYYKTGEISQKYQIDGKLEGLNTYHYPNGKVKSEYRYKEGKLTDTYVWYHPNGEKYEEGQYNEDNRVGLWKGYYSNGKIRSEGNYNNDNRTGEWKFYHKDGYLESSETYDLEGSLNGSHITYFPDGKVHFEEIYSDDKHIGYTYYDSSGKVLKSVKSEDGNFDMTGYYKNGYVSFTGSIKEGKMDGDFTYYYPSGTVKSTLTYENGLKEGPTKDYYETGQLKLSSEYKDNMLNGYYQEFYPNGNKESEGWVVDDYSQQDWKYYELDGSMSSEIYRLNGDFNGWATYYAPGNRPYLKHYYDNGSLLYFEQLDSTGNVYYSDSLDYGNGEIKHITVAGKTRYRQNLKCNESTGAIEYFYPNGQVEIKFEMAGGEKHGKYMSYFHNGKKRVEGDFEYGNETGSWRWYDYDGTLTKSQNYVEGELEGESIAYYANGEKESVCNYSEGTKVGSCKYYSMTGNLIVEKMYDEELGITGYRYELENGEMSEVVPVDKTKDLVRVEAFYRNGKPSTVQTYKKGYLHGSITYYHENGKVLEFIEYVDGSMHGKHEIYYSTGQLQKSVTNYSGDEHGVTREYFESGKLKRQTGYHLDGKHGREIRYSADGKELSNIMFYNNEPY